MNRDQGSAGNTKKERKPYTITKTRESWTEQEHEKFLEALQLFDRDWKKIEAFVGTKTVIQIRSHAQKYFLKVQKNGTGEHVPPPRPKRKCSQPYPSKATAAASGTGGGGTGTGSSGGAASAANVPGGGASLSGSGLPGVGSAGARNAAPGAGPSSRAAAMGALMGAGGVGGLQAAPGVSLPAGMAYHGGYGLGAGMMGAMGPGMMGAGGMLGGAGMMGPAGGQLAAAGLMGVNSLMSPTGVLPASGSLAGLPGSEGDLPLSVSGLPPLGPLGVARKGSGATAAGGVAGRQAGVDEAHTGSGVSVKSQVAGTGKGKSQAGAGIGEGDENGMRGLGGSNGEVSNSERGPGGRALPEDGSAQVREADGSAGPGGAGDLDVRRDGDGAVAMDSKGGEGLRDAGEDPLSSAFGLGAESLAALHSSLRPFEDRDEGELFGDAGATLDYQAQLKKLQQQQQQQGQGQGQGLGRVGPEALEGDETLLLQEQELMLVQQEGELMQMSGAKGGAPGVPSVKIEALQMAERPSDQMADAAHPMGSRVGPSMSGSLQPKAEGVDGLMLIDGGLTPGLPSAFGVGALGGQYSMLDPSASANQGLEDPQGGLREGQDGAGSFSDMLMDAAVDGTGLRPRPGTGAASVSAGGAPEESSATMGPEATGARLGSASAMDLGAVGDRWVHHAFTPRMAVSEDGKPQQCDGASAQASQGLEETDGMHLMKAGGGQGQGMLRATPDFAAVYRFIGAVFDPACSDHLTSLRKMAPIDRETVLLLMRNLSINLSSPDFEEHKLFLSVYDGSNGGSSTAAGILARSGLSRVEGNLLLPAHGSVLPEAEKI